MEFEGKYVVQVSKEIYRDLMDASGQRYFNADLSVYRGMGPFTDYVQRYPKAK